MPAARPFPRGPRCDGVRITGVTDVKGFALGHKSAEQKLNKRLSYTPHMGYMSSLGPPDLERRHAFQRHANPEAILGFDPAAFRKFTREP